MNAIKNILLLFTAFLMIINIAQAQCNASNSPTFQLTTSQVTLATNGVCGMQINIVNANTIPGGGALFYCYIAPGQSTCAPITQLSPITVAGIWTIAVQDANNYCVTNQTVQVNILPAPPVLVVASNTLVCSGYITTLTASGANSYTWNTSATTTSISITPSSTSTYSVIGTGTNVCANSASVVVNVNPLPNVTATTNQNSVCVNQNIQLTAQSANTYTWNNSATGSQYTSSAFTTTGYVTYSVQLQGTSNAGCVATKTVWLYVIVQACDVGFTEYSNSNQIKIYPNPANDFIQFELKDDRLKMQEGHVYIYNQLGQLLREEVISFRYTKTSIGITEFHEGIYSIVVSNSNGEKLTKKLIISK